MTSHHRPAALLGLALAAFAGAALPGCRCAGSPDPEADLTVATFTEFEGVARTVAGRWQSAHPGKRVELVSLPAGDFYSGMLPRIYSGAGVPDLLVVDAAFLARAGAAHFEDLGRPPYSAAALIPGLVPQAVAAARTEDGVQVGMPVATSPSLLYYRKDLLDRAGVSAAELSASWESLVAAGARIKSATGAYLAPQLLDLVYAPLLSAVEPGASVFFARGGALRLQGPRFERAFGLARTARASELGAGTGTGTHEWGKAIRAGRLALTIGGPGVLRQLAYTAPETAGAWRAVSPPGPLPTDGIYLALPRRGARHAAAWDLAASALTDEGQHAAFADATAYPALLTALGDPLLDEPVRFLGDQRLGALWRDAVQRAPGFVPHRRDPIPASSLQVALDLVLEQQKDVRAALADAEADAQKRLARLR